MPRNAWANSPAPTNGNGWPCVASFASAAMSFLYPSESAMLSILDLDPVLLSPAAIWLVAVFRSAAVQCVATGPFADTFSLANCAYSSTSPAVAGMAWGIVRSVPNRTSRTPHSILLYPKRLSRLPKGLEDQRTVNWTSVSVPLGWPLRYSRKAHCAIGGSDRRHLTAARLHYW
jgi:hypothetical protein